MLLEKVNSNEELAGQIEATDVVSGTVPVMATPTTVLTITVTMAVTDW